MRSDLVTPDVRVHSYKILPDLSLIDPFEAVELDVLKNKGDSVKVLNQPPSPFPRKLGDRP